MSKEDLVIVKTGTESITKTTYDEDEIEGSVIEYEFENLDQYAIERVATDLNALLGRSVLVSSAAITAGTRALGLAERPSNDDVVMQQIASARGNRDLFSLWEKALFLTSEYGESVRRTLDSEFIVQHQTRRKVVDMLVTHRELDQKDSWDNLLGVTATVLDHLWLPGFNENDPVSTKELLDKIGDNGESRALRFGDNDQLAAHLAVNLGRFALEFANQRTQLVILTAAGGILEDLDRPESIVREISVDEADILYDFVVDAKDFSKTRGGARSKIHAGILAAKAGVRVIISDNAWENPVMRALNGDSGTVIVPSTKEVIAAEASADHH